MKLKTHIGKVGPNGEIKIPKSYLETLGLCGGEAVALKVTGKSLVVEPVKATNSSKKKSLRDPVKELTGSLRIDPHLADAILEADYQPEDT